MSHEAQSRILVAQIREHDFAAQLVAKELGAAALPVLAGLLDDPDPTVRLLSYRCLEQIGGAAACEYSYKGLLDDDLVVAAAAMQTLEHHISAVRIADLAAAYDHQPAAPIRARLALLVGRFDTPAVLSTLHRWRETEADPEARMGLIVALARHQDQAARLEVTGELQQAAANRQERWFAACQYINQLWLLRALRPLLADVSAVRWIGLHSVAATPERAETLRTCDIAINIIVEIARSQGLLPPPTVEYRLNKNYLDSEIRIVEKWLDALPPNLA